MPRTVTGDATNLPAMLLRARKAAGYSNAHKLLAAIKASGRQAPSYSTYAQWESGTVDPRDETLEPVVAFHREQKTWPDEPQGTDLASAIRALTVELAAAREERATMADRFAKLQATVDQLVAADLARRGMPVPVGRDAPSERAE